MATTETKNIYVIMLMQKNLLSFFIRDSKRNNFFKKPPLNITKEYYTIAKEPLIQRNRNR